jgi:hypothetical protein
MGEAMAGSRSRTVGGGSGGGKRWGKHARLAGRRAPQAFSYVDKGDGALDSHPA